MSEPIVSKQCSHCKITKPTSDFYHYRHNKGGFNSQCKDCQTAYNRSEAGRAAAKRYRSNTPLHPIWGDMHDRCRNKRDAAYKNYGGRGIKVCERWNKFENFLADMGPTYQSGLTIERRDNDGPYCVENSCWATRAEQAVNRRNNHLLTYHGKTQPIAVWARELGMRPDTLWSRLHLGWPIERVLSEPVHRYPIKVSK